MPASLVPSLFWASFWLYLLSFALFVAHVALRNRRLGWWGTAALFLGFVPHTAGLVLRWIVLRHPPMQTMYEYANLMSWMLVLLFAAFLHAYRRPLLGAVVSPSLVMILVATSVLPEDSTNQTLPALRGVWPMLHVGLTALAEAAFAVGCVFSLAYLLVWRRCLKGRLPRNAVALSRLGTLEDISVRAITIGHPLFTLGALFAGSLLALTASGSFWEWDPKQVGALAVWCLYSAYLYARVVRRWRGTRLAWLSMGGFVLVLASFVSDLFLGGHPQP